MSENWSAQVSIKTPAGTLINLRGERGEHVEAQLNWVIDNAANIVKAEQAFAGVATVAAALPVQQVQQQAQSWSNQGSQQSQAPQQQYQQQAPAQGGANGEISPPQCAHGAMQRRTSKAGAARAWVAYMCPTPQGTPGQCKPVDAVTGKSWK